MHESGLAVVEADAVLQGICIWPYMPLYATCHSATRTQSYNKTQRAFTTQLERADNVKALVLAKTTARRRLVKQVAGMVGNDGTEWESLL